MNFQLYPYYIFCQGDPRATEDLKSSKFGHLTWRRPESRDKDYTALQCTIKPSIQGVSAAWQSSKGRVSTIQLWSQAHPASKSVLAEFEFLVSQDGRQYPNRMLCDPSSASNNSLLAVGNAELNYWAQFLLFLLSPLCLVVCTLYSHGPVLCTALFLCTLWHCAMSFAWFLFIQNESCSYNMLLKDIN